MKQLKFLLPLFLLGILLTPQQVESQTIINSYIYESSEPDPILDDIVGAWDFETNTTVSDLVGSVDGTGTGGTTLETGADGNAIGVDSATDESWIDFGDPAIYESMSAITVVIDVYPTENGESSVTNIIGNWWSGTSQRWHLGLNSSNYIRGRIHTGSASRDITGTNALTLNAWNRISLRWEEGTTVKIRVNTTSEQASTLTASAMGSASLGMNISADPTLSGADNRRLTGRVDNLFIWDVALTDAQMTQMHTDNPTYAELNGD